LVGRTNAIRYSTIEVREFNCTLGDNPACSRGLLISLDYPLSESIPLDEHEAKRITRRTRRDLFMSTSTRRKIVSSQLGYTKEKILVAEISINRIQKNCSKTKKEYPMLDNN